MSQEEQEGLRRICLVDDFVIQAHSPWAVPGIAPGSVATAVELTGTAGAEVEAGSKAVLSHWLVSTGALASANTVPAPIC